MDTLPQNLSALGHILIGFYFVCHGFWNIYHWAPLLKAMAADGIPHPYLILSFGITLEIIAGFFLMFGIFVKTSAFILLLFTIISVFIFHPFWKYRGELRLLNFSIFLVNLTATVGGLLLIISQVQNVIVP